MATGCMLSLLLLLVATIILFVMTEPPGWILAGLFAIAAVVVTLVKGVDWKQWGFQAPSKKKHGPEDIGRGPDDDQMLK